MSVKALTGLLPEWYTLESELNENGDPVDDAAAFYVVPLTQVQVLELQGEHMDMEAEMMKASGFAAAFRIGCKDWRNVVDDQGNPLPWNRANATHIAAQHQQEVGIKIFNISIFTEDDLKN